MRSQKVEILNFKILFSRLTIESVRVLNEPFLRSTLDLSKNLGSSKLYYFKYITKHHT